MDPCQLLTPPQIADNPELAPLAILETAIETSATAILAQYPEIPAPEWPLQTRHPPDPATYAANLLLTVLRAARDTARAYRETVMRPAPRIDPDRKDHHDTPIF